MDRLVEWAGSERSQVQQSIDRQNGIDSGWRQETLSTRRSGVTSSAIQASSVLLFDAHQLLRAGLVRLLEAQSNISVVGDAVLDERSFEMARALRPDVILICVHSEHETEIWQVLSLLRNVSASKVVAILTFPPGPAFTRRLFERVDGILAHDSSPQDLVSAIRRVSSGRCHIASEIAHHLVAKVRTPTTLLERLSGRELEVVAMTIDGLRPQEIAIRMAISRRTIGTMRHRIFKKLNVRTDAELVRIVLGDHIGVEAREVDL